MTGNVVLRHVQRVFTDVYRIDFSILKRIGTGNTNATTASTQIQNLCGLINQPRLKALLD